MFFNKIKSLKELKKEYKKLSKYYHPDNKQTGDKEQFIKLKEEYNEIYKYLKSLPIPIIIKVPIDKAYTGCTYNHYTEEGKLIKITIPPKFYNTDGIVINSSNGKKYIVSVVIKSLDNEKLEYSSNGNIIITKFIDVNLLDVLDNKEIAIKTFKDDIKFNLGTNIINKTVCLKDVGYPYRNNRDKNNVLKVKFKIKDLKLNDNDKKIIHNMRKEYE